MLVDFHCHTTLSDGTLSIDEMVEAAERRGYTALAITDHAEADNPAYCDIAAAVREAVERLRFDTSMYLFAGVELTGFEPFRIPQIADEVRRHGAEVVVVHGECVTMDVMPGTNAAAVRSPGVDILAHPGLLLERDADAAVRYGIYLELSARPNHCYANGHVYATARKAGAPVIVDSDAHDEAGLLSSRKSLAILRGAGASPLFVHRYEERLAPDLLQRLIRRHAAQESRAAS
jgi:histidinol phosphatase-like PHP family hydrolase